jgi:hypothetical protein
LEGLEKGHCFFYGTIFVLVVNYVKSLSRLRVVFYVAFVLFVAELEAAAGLAYILFIAC